MRLACWRMRPRIRELSSMCLSFRVPCALSNSKFKNFIDGQFVEPMFFVMSSEVETPLTISGFCSLR